MIWLHAWPPNCRPTVTVGHFSCAAYFATAVYLPLAMRTTDTDTTFANRGEYGVTVGRLEERLNHGRLFEDIGGFGVIVSAVH